MITIQRRNPYIATLTVTDSDGNAYDLTGITVFFTVKNKTDHEDDDAAAVITKDITVHTDAAGGITTLALTAVDTDVNLGDYKYDIRLYSGSVQLNSTRDICSIVDIVTKRVIS